MISFLRHSYRYTLIIDNALKAYRKFIKTDPLTHPLADQLKLCDSASGILTVFQGQVQELNHSQCSKMKVAGPNCIHPPCLLRDTWRTCQLGMLQNMNLCKMCPLIITGDTCVTRSREMTCDVTTVYPRKSLDDIHRTTGIAFAFYRSRTNSRIARDTFHRGSGDIFGLNIPVTFA